MNLLSDEGDGYGRRCRHSHGWVLIGLVLGNSLAHDFKEHVVFVCQKWFSGMGIYVRFLTFGTSGAPWETMGAAGRRKETRGFGVEFHRCWDDLGIPILRVSSTED